VIDVSVLIDARSFDDNTREVAVHGVTSALVASRTGATYRMRIANDLALSLAGVHGGVRVYPVATLNPVEYLDWEAELERVLAAGAIAVRFFPDAQKWTVASRAFRDIVAAVRGRCPLLLPVTNFGDASAIGEATQYADAPVILLGAHYTQLGDCLAAIKRWPHLYLETSRLAHFRATETVVREIGASRVLFGTDAPTRPVQAPLNAVLTAAISDEERRAILADNAARIFGIASEPFAMPTPVPAASLVDVHAHTGALGFPTPAVEDHAQVVAKNGITRSMTSSLRAIADDVDAGNAECFAAASDSLHPYVVLDPRDIEASCAAMDDAYRRDVAVGAKIHCGWSRTHTATRKCINLVREVARRGRPLLIHVDGPEWSSGLLDVALEWPNWKLIVAHAGPGTPVLDTACLVERTSNVYAELCTSFPDRAIVCDVVQRIGPERLLFGSDAPLLDPGYVQGIYADAQADLACTASLALEVFGL
jgi:predicted TIM-barrel fold metal-dependent hydrolase